jgi:membrane fusion protein (multidrug efflux system)
MARLTDDTQAVGSLRSRRSVVLRPEVSGRITRLNFTDGQRVRKGQVLVQFDDQLQQAQVQQSQAELSIALANQKRNQELVAQNFVSQRSLDESAANLQVAQAKLALARATAARLKIVAPFDGIAGIRQVSAGDYLKDGADIVNIEDIEAIYVDFRLPERFQAKLKRGQTAMLNIDALPGQQYLAQIQAIDPLIDVNGRSVGVRACIDNRQLQLRPGMFARVNTVFGVKEDARVIPEEAIVPQAGKQFVIKLLKGPSEQTRTTQRVEVKVGLRSPGKVEILEGLAPGDTVITTGQQRVQRDGTVVTVVSPAGNGMSGKKGGRPAEAPAVQAPAPEAVLARAPAVPAPMPGPNPCGAVVSDARPAAAPAPMRHAAPASLAPRDPA